MMAWGWNCSAEMVHICDTPPSTPWRRARALLWPLTSSSTLRASITVPTPTVRAVFGTRFTSPPKKRELAMMVSWVRVFWRVREVSDEPGSLKAMWPSGPTPPMNSSMPP